ncbi:endoplasmic reticulum vesicle transporter-domain-containing protein [Cyathus striatus]|nr:endoplasmic reticulum vesicle transporter-domain-containing protein [Cyathus striatus]
MEDTSCDITLHVCCDSASRTFRPFVASMMSVARILAWPTHSSLKWSNHSITRIGEYIWGRPDDEFSIDDKKQSYLNINLDITVQYDVLLESCVDLSTDLRDAIGDRFILSGRFHWDGTKCDTGQITTLREHSEALSASRTLAQSRESRGFFSTLFRFGKRSFKPTYTHKEDSDSCRIFGTMMVKRVTASLHIITLGHGYASYEHVEHDRWRGVDGMNLSHIITKFSFGPFPPEMAQPLYNSFEVMTELRTTYIAPRSTPLNIHQYSVTHDTRTLEHNRGTPGIFFKFDIDPLSITIHQRTTSLLQLFIRAVGVVEGVFICVGYGLRVSRKVGEVVSGEDKQEWLVAAQASGARVGLRAKWAGGELRSGGKAGGASAPGSPWYDTGSGAGQGGMLSVPPSPMVNGGVNGNGGGYVAKGGHNGHVAPPRRSVVSPKKDD